MNLIFKFRSVRLCLIFILIFPSLCFAEFPPQKNGNTLAPDSWLLGEGQRWDYHTSTAKNIQEIIYVEPTIDEISVIEKGKFLLANSNAKSMAMIDGNKVVWVGYKQPTTESSRFLSFSMAKTITSMSVGKAICSKKLSLDTVAQDIVPELSGTDLGKATVKNLLTMSSGSWNGPHDGLIFEPEHDWPLSHAKLSILDVISAPKATAAELDDQGKKRKAGQKFSYHNTDPLLLGVMINKVVGISYAKWAEQEVLIPAGIRNSAYIGQDWFEYAYTEGNVRMTMEDWIRFAIWVKNSESSKDCFGEYVKAATKTQITNNGADRIFDGYGYLVWTENKFAKDSYWAVGWGGQRIGWNHKNQRIIVSFSNSLNYVNKLYELYAEWAALP